MVVILASLAGEARHGYALLADVEKLSGGRVSLGTGTLLRRHPAFGWRTGGLSALKQEDTSRDKQAYRLTVKGRKHLEAEIARMRQILPLGRKQGTDALSAEEIRLAALLGERSEAAGARHAGAA